jgi:hypothetical protein
MNIVLTQTVGHETTINQLTTKIYYRFVSYLSDSIGGKLYKADKRYTNGKLMVLLSLLFMKSNISLFYI